MPSDRPSDKGPDETARAEQAADTLRDDSRRSSEPAPSQMEADGARRPDADLDHSAAPGPDETADKRSAAAPAPSQLERYEADASQPADVRAGTAQGGGDQPQGAQDAPDRRLLEARDARDALADQVRYSRKPGAVTGGYNTQTGEVAAGSSGPLGCAEGDVVRQLGGDASRVQFTEAVRPRTGEPVDICISCQDKYEQSQFPPGTEGEKGGRWSRK